MATNVCQTKDFSNHRASHQQPPKLGLRKICQAAIRTQPGDLLAWSSAYFRALAEGIPPPAKDRIEYPPIDTPSGLSPGFLKVLINQ
ncbi:hypothetical protein GE061_006507, partial [Apolygus lucorum]